MSFYPLTRSCAICGITVKSAAGQILKNGGKAVPNICQRKFEEGKELRDLFRRDEMELDYACLMNEQSLPREKWSFNREPYNTERRMWAEETLQKK